MCLRQFGERSRVLDSKTSTAIIPYAKAETQSGRETRRLTSQIQMHTLGRWKLRALPYLIHKYVNFPHVSLANSREDF